MKLLSVLLVVVLFAGCASAPKLDARKKERYGTYAALSPEMKAAVDAGQIKVGMPMDAVYIAWGPPSQSLQSADPSGEAITWLYHGGYVQEVRYWGRRNLHYAYDPRTYIRAQVVFVNGLVQSFQTFPEPVY
ncbi:hypothetical protein [Pedosphaera parvula]|uniref:Lipoprotein n=1 Tax=Pedosphaera parvula (strain Ellin514) TaxID=320771 RepID=B9XPY5_PEDPL|nr:hypothetical protein [Pedosphaera parvula]EEF58082.1 conserved hypothetical protein [Pedosphaera parvula Ellin514]